MNIQDLLNTAFLIVGSILVGFGTWNWMLGLATFFLGSIWLNPRK